MSQTHNTRSRRSRYRYRQELIPHYRNSWHSTAMPAVTENVRCWGVDRPCHRAAMTSQFDPSRTSRPPHLTAAYASSNDVSAHQSKHRSQGRGSWTDALEMLAKQFSLH